MPSFLKDDNQHKTQSEYLMNSWQMKTIKMEEYFVSILDQFKKILYT